MAFCESATEYGRAIAALKNSDMQPAPIPGPHLLALCVPRHQMGTLALAGLLRCQEAEQGGVEEVAAGAATITAGEVIVLGQTCGGHKEGRGVRLLALPSRNRGELVNQSE